MNRQEFKQYIKDLVDSMLQKIPNYGSQHLSNDLPEEFWDKMTEGIPDNMADQLYDEIKEDLSKLKQKFGLGDSLENLDDLENLLDWHNDCAGGCDSNIVCDHDECGCQDNPCDSTCDNDWEHKKICKPDHCKGYPPHHHKPDNRWLKCFIFVCIKLKIILCLLKHRNFGLKEIKKEIRFIEKAIFSPSFGLKEIKREVKNIEQGVFSPTFGLPEIKSEVSAIETIVGGILTEINNPTYGLLEIKSEVSEILSIISNLNIEFPLTLLSDIKSEISAIEGAVFNPTFGLPEIKSEISFIETIVGGILTEINNPTFGLAEIKSEVSEILSIISNLNIEFPITLLSDIKSEISAIEGAVLSPTFGLVEIKSEVSAIEGAVFNPTFGLPEIKSEISFIETIVGGILTEINNPTFGLAEIKSEVSEILALATEIRQITLDSILLLLNETFGLSEIKAEISTIEGAVSNPAFGLPEIKSEVSLLVAEFAGFLSARGPAQNLTTGPFLQTINETSLEVKAYNATGTPQNVTFTVLGVNDNECPPNLLATTTLTNIPSCCVQSEVLDISAHTGNIIVNVQTTSTSGIFLYAATISGGEKITEFFSADFLPLGTVCTG
ncbi:hypothetical protein [Desulforamulus ferrireducens]|uniref:hypothetical protein n=1 Tax=Desulforamulus ferrireducens TaxID=1833852 RepID=UPI0015CFCC60|nr:hypothetical protein [Desulforamulus ferrireducens]